MRKPRLLKCQPHERKILETALKSVRGIVSGGALPALGLDRLRQRMLARLDGKRSLSIRCSDDRNRSALTILEDRDRGEIVIGRPAFLLGGGRIAPLLFRQLVLICGGATLDAEALQHHCFPGGGPPPSPQAFSRFRARRQDQKGLYVGRYVLWDPRTGQLFIRAGTRKQVEAGPPLLPTFMEAGAAQGGLAAEPWPAPGDGRDPVIAGGAVEAEAEVAARAGVDAPGTAGAEVAAETGADASCAAEADEAPEEVVAAVAASTPRAEAPAQEPKPAPNWLETPIPVTALLASMSVPKEARGLVQEFMDLGPLTPVEWTELLGKMTQLLMEAVQANTPSPPDHPASPSAERSGVDDES